MTTMKWAAMAAVMTVVGACGNNDVTPGEENSAATENAPAIFGGRAITPPNGSSGKAG